MGSKLNLINLKFGRLTVLEASENKNNRTMWKCICECGNIKFVRTYDLTSNKTLSCGCLGKERRLDKIKTHNMTNTPEYKTWRYMLSRCLNINNKDYEHYGGRGIYICEEWLNSFSNFFKDMGNKPSNKHSLDRIDVNGNYCKENCRWATQSIQVINRRKLKETSNPHRGVYYIKEQNCYLASINIFKKRITIGKFKVLNDAINARLSAEKERDILYSNTVS